MKHKSSPKNLPTWSPRNPTKNASSVPQVHPLRFRRRRQRANDRRRQAQPVQEIHAQADGTPARERSTRTQTALL